MGRARQSISATAMSPRASTRDPFAAVLGSGRGLMPQAFLNEEDGRTVRSYYLDNDDRAGVLHRVDGPALVITKKDGTVEESYYEQGQLHCAGAPARITTTASGECQQEYFCEGQLHREDGPAVTVRSAEGDIVLATYYREGVMHRADGPADVSASADGRHEETYYWEGQMHREDGPASTATFAEGSYRERWYYQGRLHREDGPADVEVATDGSRREKHFRNGVPCNADGRALTIPTFAHESNKHIKNKFINFDNLSPKEDKYKNEKFYETRAKLITTSCVILATRT
jgi:hypothetical protein